MLFEAVVDEATAGGVHRQWRPSGIVAERRRGHHHNDGGGGGGETVALAARNPAQCGRRVCASRRRDAPAKW